MPATPARRRGRIFLIIVDQNAPRAPGAVTADTLVDLQLLVEREREQRRRADAANRAKDEFLATLAHELRQPLAAALTAVELQKFSPTPEAQERARVVIERQLKHMLRLVDDISEASRIARGALDLRRERLDVRSVIEQALEMTAPQFQARRQTVTLALANEPAWVDGDAVRLKQVFANLLQNAARYTPAGGRIDVRLEADSRQVRATIQDDGPGIPAAALDQIFELFERGSQRDARGLGIGLALVRRLVELHGGTVSASSEGAGRGSEFTVTLPRL
jgi:signal transduction histidine kinase